MKEQKLGDLCTITSSKRIFANQYVNEGVPFYRSKEIIEKKYFIQPTETLYIAESIYQQIKSKYGAPIKGDMLLTSVGTLGVPYIVQDEKFYFKDGNLTWFKDFEDSLSSQYLYYWFTSNTGRQSLFNVAIGSSQPALTIEILKKYKLKLPKRSIQNKIVKILSTYDELIMNNNKRIKILEKMAENLYKEWFVRFRFPEHENVEFVDGVPKGWTFKRIEKIGKVVAGGTPSTNVNEYWNGSVPWLTPADLSNYDGIYIKNGSTNISELGLKKSSAVLLPANTVLLSSRAPIGYVALAKQPITTNQGFKSVVCNEKIVNCYYLFYFFKMNRSLLESFGSGATFLELSAKGLSRVKILVPSINIQKEFGSIIKKVAEKIDNFQLQNQNLIKQRDLLLPRLMSGKLQVK